MVTISKYCILLVSGATVHGFPVIRTDQPSRFGTQVIRGSADNFFFLSAVLLSLLWLLIRKWSDPWLKNRDPIRTVRFVIGCTPITSISLPERYPLSLASPSQSYRERELRHAMISPTGWSRGCHVVHVSLNSSKRAALSMLFYGTTAEISILNGKY